MRPDVFASIEAAAIERGLSERDRGQALCLISKIVLHTGKDVDQLSSDDVLEVFAWSVCGHPRRKEVPGLHTAWDLLSVIGVTPAGLTLHAALRRGQRPTTELVDDDDIRCRPVRDVLVRYLDERRPVLDYNSLGTLAGVLAGSFWAEIEEHHPGIDTLHLPDEVAQAWKQRVCVVTTADVHGEAAQGHSLHPDESAGFLSRHRAVGVGRPELGVWGRAPSGAQERHPGI